MQQRRQPGEAGGEEEEGTEKRPAAPTPDIDTFRLL